MSEPRAGRSYDRAVLVGDRDRDRAAYALREHYASGRLSLDELAARTARVVAARSRGDILRALWGLPVGRSRLRRAKRGIALALATAAYVVFNFTLLIAFAVTLIVEGPTTAVLLAFLVVWLLPTYLLARLWRSG
jgi:DUF1707 SHOCT-like domain